ncbi:MAG TPA: hydrogenase nickel incorporation protein HypB [Gemmatales bacterium]|mgnify:CR=1 FL=1|nr:hydrogenase nickel incorporation protein HypB [Gemmatales bacterium]
MVHLVSSPGAGKTSLLEATAQYLSPEYKLGILVGDIATDRDAERLKPWAPTVQLTSGGACHLEVPLIQRGWKQLALERCDFLFIENIGNLVCPASFDLGEHLRVVLLSVTEGDDKPGKYPKMFRTSHALLLTKADLLPWLPFSVEAAISDARAIQPELTCLTLSAWKKQGLEAWFQYLIDQRNHLLAQLHE